jgi:hypothetical protein
MAMASRKFSLCKVVAFHWRWPPCHPRHELVARSSVIWCLAPALPLSVPVSNLPHVTSITDGTCLSTKHSGQYSRQNDNTVTHLWVCRLDIGFTDHFNTPLGATSNCRATTLYKSLGNSESSESSLVVSWQRIYTSLTVTTAHIKSSFRCRKCNTQLTSFDSSVICQLPTPELSIQFSAATANSGTLNPVLCCSCQLRNSQTSSLLQLPTVSLPSLLSHLRLPLLNWLSVRFSLRLAVYCQSVRFGDKPLETHEKPFFFNWTLGVIVLM